VTQPLLLLLDVDGVLNALADEGENYEVWQGCRHGGATCDGTAWPTMWVPSVIEALRGWHQTGAVELQWLTT
jgi:hypothetical protein